MGRQDYQYWTVTGVKGVNQQEDLADPEQELADARNFWAPDGAIVSRPGDRNFSSVYGLVGNNNVPGFVIKYESPSVPGLFINTIPLSAPNNPPLGGFAYFGVTGTAPILYWLAGDVSSTGTATNDPKFTVQYWNGTYWAPGVGWYVNEELLNGTTFGNGIKRVEPVFNDVAGRLGFGLALGNHGAWARTSVDSQEAYWFRIKITNEAALYSAGTFQVGTLKGVPLSDQRIVGMWAVQFPSTKRYISILVSENSKSVIHNNASDLFWGDNNSYGEAVVEYQETEPATIAVVPQFEEAFVAYDHKIRRHTAYPTYGGMTDSVLALNSANFNPVEAKVEQRPEFVGPDAPYDKDNFIAQLATFPEAKYITFFEGRLWAAGLKDDPFTVRWSAPQPYHKVWPLLNAEPLMEDDNSPISGLAALGEHMVVFKQDSIWIMVDTGINEFGLQTFSPKRVVAGVGCAANSSIQKIRGRLVFLAEDGVYAFDGTPNIEKLSDRVSKYISKIPPGQRAWCSSVHWREKSCYILSIPNTTRNLVNENFTVYTSSTTTTVNPTNNLTLVWDYKNDSWWPWENMSPRVWISDEGVGDQQQLYYGTDIGQIREFGKVAFTGERNQDAWLLTQRQWEKDYHRKTIRNINVDTGNDVGGVWVEPLTNDAEGLQTRVQVLASTTVLNMPNPDTSIEKGWSDFDWGGGTDDDNWSYPRRSRRRGRVRKDGDWHRLKVWHIRDGGNQDTDGIFEFEGIELGMIVKGRR